MNDSIELKIEMKKMKKSIFRREKKENKEKKQNKLKDFHNKKCQTKHHQNG